MSRIRMGAWTVMAAILGLGFPQPAAAQDQAAVLVEDCAVAARQFFGDFEARTDMRYNDARADGTRTVGGNIYLETRSAYVACAFAPRERRLIEFYVDEVDRLADLQSGNAGAGDFPNYERPVGGVLPAGSDFTASSIIPCARPGTGQTQCDAGVVREGNGNGFVMVFWPDAGSRVLYFENGTIVRYDESQADGGARLSVTRNGDVQVVRIGEMKFEVVDALLVGG